MATLTEFNPAAHGLRVADPIQRKPRTPSARKAPKPPFADAVWWSFQEAKPLETVVRTSGVADTVRALKRAARYNEREHKGNEVRVQIAVEAALEDDGKTPRKGFSTVKFLGHEPFMLGRRISMERVNPEDDANPPASTAPKHRKRTVAHTRGQHAKTALRGPVVRAVITPHDPSFPGMTGGWGRGVFPEFPLCRPSPDSGVRHGCYNVRKPIDSLYLPSRPGGGAKEGGHEILP